MSVKGKARTVTLSRLMGPQTVGLRGRGAHIAGRLPLLSSVAFSIFAPIRSTRPFTQRPALLINGPFPDAPSYIQSIPYFDPTHTRTGWIGQPPILNRHEVVTIDGDVDILGQATP